MSEDFIREFADKVNWNNISEHQALSDEFTREFEDRFCYYDEDYYDEDEDENW